GAVAGPLEGPPARLLRRRREEPRTVHGAARHAAVRLVADLPARAAGTASGRHHLVSLTDRGASRRDRDVAGGRSESGEQQRLAAPVAGSAAVGVDAAPGADAERLDRGDARAPADRLDHSAAGAPDILES